MKRILLLFFEFLLTLFLLPFLGPLALPIGAVIIIATFLLTRRGKERLGLAKPITLRRFLGLLQIVALVAILYSPSALHISAGGGSNLVIAESFSAIQPYLTSLHSKYSLIVANNTESLQMGLSQPGKKAYFLIGPDENHNLTSTEAEIVSSRYLNGTLSLLVSEGNSTNNSFLHSLFHVQVKGDAILDQSSRFHDNRVFNITGQLDTQTVAGVLDIASPIIFENLTSMWTVAASSDNSTERSYDYHVQANTTMGTRTVVAASETNGDRALLISDSAPFSTAYNGTFSSLGVNEAAFVEALTDWVTGSDTNMTIIIDNAHYRLPQNVGGSLGLNLSIGRIFALVLAFIIVLTSAFYTGFLSFSRPFILGVALLTTWSLYGTLTRRYATEKKGKDDEPLPKIEKSILAESKERRDFLKTSRRKGFYVATLDQMYDVLDALTFREFGTEISALKLEQLTARLGDNQGILASRLFKRLGKIAEYARGDKRLLFPPVLRWKRTTARLTGQTEQVLNQLGLTMTGKGQKKQLDYRLRRG